MRTLTILSLTAALAACSGSNSTDNSQADPVALVRLAPATSGQADQQITVYGSTEPGPMGRMSLAAPIEANVVAIDAPVGTPVGSGQVVVRLAASPTSRADSVKANADATAANAALARAGRLRADGLVADTDVETARAAAAAANALRDSFARRGGALTLRAPAAAVVETIPVAVGDLLQPGAAVATLVRSADLRARFGVDPASTADIRPGMILHLPASGARAPLDVPVASVSNALDPQTKLAALFVRLPANSGFRPGEPLTASVDVRGGGNAISIPYAAVLDDGGQAYVFVVDKCVAHRRDVTVASSTNQRAVIGEGLRAGEQVVVEGGTGVEDGIKVRTR